MKTVIFVVDESGAKGYSDNTEMAPGEFGLVAGYFIPLEYLSIVQTELNAIRTKYFSMGKIHITDLNPEAQQALREEIFTYFRKRNIFWAYEAIYVEGFHQHEKHVSELTNQARSTNRSNIRMSNNTRLELLHVELFQGAFGKGMAFCIDKVGFNCEIRVITDRVDGKLLSLFSKAADELLNVGEKREHTVKGYDLEAKVIVEGAIKSEVISGHDALGDFSGISYSIICEDSSLTLAADVLANSVHYHLKQLQKSSLGTHLNTLTAITNHPLEQLVYGAWQNPEANYIIDTVYMHPKSKTQVK